MYDLKTGVHLHTIQKQLQPLLSTEVYQQFELDSQDTLLKTTISLCDVCQIYAPACVFERGEQVLLNKRCDTHGMRQAILENDKRFYRLSNKDQWGKPYSLKHKIDFPVFNTPANSCCAPNVGCGTPAPSNPTWKESFADQSNNKTCTVLVEVTNACDLACRVCYADAKGDRVVPFDQFKRYITDLILAKQHIDSMQITGGEALLHPQIWDIFDWLYKQDQIKKIYLPTNGIQLSKGEIYKKLLPYKDKLLVLLQFDGEEVATNQALRHANPLKVRLKVLKNLNRIGIAMQLTMTLSYGVSEKEIAWVVSQGRKHKNVRLVAMQPAFFAGRYELAHQSMHRLTLSDVAKGVADAFPKYVTQEDFLPIPCSHPNCGWVTLFARRFGLLINIAKFVDLDSVMNDVANKTLLNQEEMRSMLGTNKTGFLKKLSAKVGRYLIRTEDVFGIVIKPFMDQFNYDQDRVSACCHHTLNNDGQLISFCEYNVRYREQDSWEKFDSIKVVQIADLGSQSISNDL